MYSKKMDLVSHFGDIKQDNAHQGSLDGLNSRSQSRTKKDNVRSSSVLKDGGNSQGQSKASFLDDEIDTVDEECDKYSDFSIGQFQNESVFMNNLESKITLTEKLSKKLYPIYSELIRKISIVEVKQDKENEKDALYSSDEEKKQKLGNKDKSKPFDCDLRHILGFLNQTEWVQNLNIGNIMQITPIRLEELT